MAGGSYVRRMDLCDLPFPASVVASVELGIKRQRDTLIFNDPNEKLKFERRVKELHQLTKTGKHHE